MSGRPDSRFLHRWHVAINGCAEPHSAKRFMYEAKAIADEVPRLALIFGMERSGKLATEHRQCSHSTPEPVSENYLTCCLGVRCDACPFLAAIESADLPDDEKDLAKAWTCAAHVVSEGGDPANEGYVLTVDDRMYWDRVYRSMAENLQ